MGAAVSLSNRAARNGRQSLSVVMKGRAQDWTVNMGFEDGNIEKDTSLVEHYMPPTFPLEAFLDPLMMEKCRVTWGMIMAGTAEGMRAHAHTGRAGIVLFYDEFFFRLFKRAKVFLDIFEDPVKRGEVLMKAFGFMLRLEGDDNETEKRRCFYLGKSHRFKGKVRPWHFSMYIETALETLVFWMGSDADVETGEAWTCLVAYTLRRMLEAYLVDRVLPNEWFQNVEIDAVRKILTQSVHSKQTSQGGGSQYSSQGASQLGLSETDAALAAASKNAELDHMAPDATPAPQANVGDQTANVAPRKSSQSGSSANAAMGGGEAAAAAHQPEEYNAVVAAATAAHSESASANHGAGSGDNDGGGSGGDGGGGRSSGEGSEGGGGGGSHGHPDHQRSSSSSNGGGSRGASLARLDVGAGGGSCGSGAGSPLGKLPPLPQRLNSQGLWDGTTTDVAAVAAKPVAG
ncbi:unnamed protein product [Phaeothamnion confervicola]